MLKFTLLIFLYTVTAMAGNLQNADFATSAQITGSGGTVAQLLNSSKMYNTVDSEIMNTSIARWNAKQSALSFTSPLVNTAGTVTCNVSSGAQAGCLSSTDWTTFNSKGSVTSVAATVPAFLSIAGSPITTSGTLAISLSGTALPIANGGTAGTTANGAFNNLSPMTTAGDLTYENATPVAARLAIGSAGNVLTVSGGLPVWAPPATSGTVTAVSVASANGFTGTSSGGATPALTLATSITGVLKGNGTAISAAASGTDYQAPISTSSAVANQFVTGFTAPNTFTRAQPTFTDISGTATAAQLPAPATSAISASAIDWSTLKNVDGLYTKTLSANTTFTWSNVAAGQTIVVALTNTASNYTVTWPAAAKWPGGTAPTQTVGAHTDVYTCKSYDGTNAYCQVVANY